MGRLSPVSTRNTGRHQPLASRAEADVYISSNLLIKTRFLASHPKMD
jgi:hypothetical protein